MRHQARNERHCVALKLSLPPNRPAHLIEFARVQHRFRSPKIDDEQRASSEVIWRAGRRKCMFLPRADKQLYRTEPDRWQRRAGSVNELRSLGAHLACRRSVSLKGSKTERAN